MTAPITASLTRPLTKLASACFENSRLKPASGEILRELRLQRFGRPHQAMLDHVAGDRREHQQQRTGGRSRRSPRCRACSATRDEAAAVDADLRSELAISPRNVVVRPPLIEPENASASASPPAITNQVLTSWLLTTSPRSSASSSRFCVGSSVRSCRRARQPCDLVLRMRGARWRSTPST